MFSPQRSVEYARELLSVAAMVAPGYSELRAYLSHHAATPLYWLVKVSHGSASKSCIRIASEGS